jgi:TatD DNase family protein
MAKNITEVGILDIELVDIGSNLTHESFAGDRDAVIARAIAAGVARQIVTGADLAGSRAAASLAADNPSRLWSTAGVHPHHAASFDTATRDALVALLRQPQVVAVGECGLDYFRNFSTPAAQRAAFVAQLDITVTAAKPVFLHQRDAHADFKAILEDFRGRLRGVAHCFTGDRSQADDYLALGLHIGITGWVCDERRGSHLRDVVPMIPANRLMVETDAPYLLPRDMRPRPKSRRNEPAYLAHIAQRVADLRGESLTTLAATSTRNAIELFGLT